MSEGERAAISFFDTPIQIASAFPSKKALERVQLEKYRLDYLLLFGSVPFEDVRFGDTPPDFVVMHDGSEYGVDCAALALEEKRKAEALFSRLIQKVTDNAKTSLQHLAGTNIGIWFGHGNELPLRATDEPKVQELIEALEQFVVNRAQNARIKAEIAEHGWPDQWSESLSNSLGVVDKDGFGFQVDPVDRWQPQNALGAQLGFNISLSFTLLAEEGHHVHAEMQRLISQHDNGKIDQLLLSIGSPGPHGFYFPAEQQLSLLLKKSINPVSAQHIGRVTAHNWLRGCADRQVTNESMSDKEPI